MKFSQRIGIAPVKSALQIESLDNDLRNSIWNIIIEDFFGKLSDDSHYHGEGGKSEASRAIWKYFFKKPIDSIPTSKASGILLFKEFIGYVRNWYFSAQWYEVYDFIECIAEINEASFDTDFEVACNLILKKELSGYRIINSKIIQITSEQEIQEIEEALMLKDILNPVKIHLEAALNLLADRKVINYRNSIKESISAVESLCKIICSDDNATLGKALELIEKKHQIHGALKKAFSAIYGYTSDSSGIRHSLTNESVNVEFEDAKFMLVSCSAFINYLIAKTKS